MHYQRRSDGMIAVTVDSNVWNLFHDLDLCLVLELPPEKFRLYIPREVEIEIAAIPARKDKADLKQYIRAQIIECDIQTTAVFGFAHQGEGPQRHGGFGFGTFQSENERQFYDAVRDRFLIGKSSTKSLLTKNEADAVLGASSLSSVVLTLDLKPGPLKFAQDNGGKVLDMRPFCASRISLADFITACHEVP